jgi:hypothetical protein
LPQDAYVTETASSGCLGISFAYAEEPKFFRWTGNIVKRHALFEADFGTGPAKLPAAVSLLAPEMALSEAMFF